ncbi:hypothetical protein Tco_0435046 [Tanacetum coccineum]
MSISTISSDSMAESVRSSASHGIAAPPVGAPAIVLVVDFESEPFEDPPTTVTDFEPFEDPALPVVTADSELEAELLGSPATFDYYDGLEAHRIVTAPPSPSPPPSPLSPLPSSSLLLSPAHFRPFRKRSRPSPSSSAGPSRKRCRSPSPAALTSAELALVAPALPSIPIDLLPPHKRFDAIERIKTAEREIESLRARLATTESQIVMHQRRRLVETSKRLGIELDFRGSSTPYTLDR